MKKQHPLFLKGLFYLLVAVSFSVSAMAGTSARPAGDHPYYLHALSDLRAARWMIEHRPGNWAQTVDERNEHDGRLHVALDFLRKARQDISHDEDNRFAEGLQGRPSYLSSLNFNLICSISSRMD